MDDEKSSGKKMSKDKASEGSPDGENNNGGKKASKPTSGGSGGEKRQDHSEHSRSEGTSSAGACENVESSATSGDDDDSAEASGDDDEDEGYHTGERREGDACENIFQYALPMKRQHQPPPIYSHKTSTLLPSGETLHIVCSNQQLFGDPDLKSAYQSYKAHWNLQDGWAALKQDMPRKSSLNSTKYGQNGKKTVVHTFIVDVTSMYHIFQHGREMLDLASYLSRMTAQEWNRRNSKAGKDTRQNVESRWCLDIREPDRSKGSTYNTYLMLISSAWHFTQDSMGEAGPVEMDEEGSECRLQFKLMSKAFGDTCMKSGSSYILQSDLRTLVESKEVHEWLRNVKLNPNVKLNKRYTRHVKARMSDPDLLAALDEDMLKVDYAGNKEGRAKKQRQSGEKRSRGDVSGAASDSGCSGDGDTIFSAAKPPGVKRQKSKKKTKKLPKKKEAKDAVGARKSGFGPGGGGGGISGGIKKKKNKIKQL